MASKKPNRVSAQKKGRGLSKGEKIAIPVIIIIAVWAVYSFTQPAPTSSTLSVTYSSTPTLTQSSAAPDFTLPVVGANGLTGQSLTLSSLRGKVVLVEFMEPWCPHCQNMAPVLDSLNAKFGGGNVTFVSVAGPWNGATANDAASFIHNYGTSWVYVYDSSGTVFNNFGVNSTPTFFIIGRDGSILSNFTGEQSAETLSGALSAAVSS
jgi:thiol-disulfide isomerase/thioredoxin